MRIGSARIANMMLGVRREGVTEGYNIHRSADRAQFDAAPLEFCLPAGHGKIFHHEPQIFDRSIAYKGYLTIEKLHIKLADGGVVSRDIESHGNAVAVLPYDAKRQCALVVRLFRAPVFAVTQEVALEEACAGMINVGENEETAVRREAHEELGVSLHGLERVVRAFGRAPAYQPRDSACSLHPTRPRIGRVRAGVLPASTKGFPSLSDHWSNWLLTLIRTGRSTASSSR